MAQRSVLLALLLAPALHAAARQNALEYVHEKLSQDRSLDASRRQAIEAALKARFANYGFNVVNPDKPQDAQTLLLTGDAVQMIEVQVDDPDRASQLLEPVRKKYEGQAVVNDWKSINASLFEALAVERVAMFVVLSIIVLVAVFNILSSLIMLVRAKTRDIAILRTMGATRRSILKVFVLLGFVIGAIGTLAGLGLGFVFLFFRQGVVRFIELVTGQNLWDPSIRFLTELPSRSDPVEITVICLMALLFSFLATLYPAFKAASTDPVQVLRYE